MTSSTRMYIEFHPWIFLYIFVNFMETELATNSHTVFYHFSPRYEITKFWMIRQCLSISDAIPANKHKLYTNYAMAYMKT